MLDFKPNLEKHFIHMGIKLTSCIVGITLKQKKNNDIKDMVIIIGKQPR